VNTLMKRDGPKAPADIHGLATFKFLPEEKANAIARRLGKRFTPHDLCDEHHEQWVEGCVQALLEVEDSIAPPPRKSQNLYV